MMWRRLVSVQLKALASASVSNSCRSIPKNTRLAVAIPISSSTPASFFARYFSSDSPNVPEKKKVENISPVATGDELEELEAEAEGRDILGINYPEGPFGTKESPAVIKSYYDKRIVGCPGGEGEDEHDVVWFWLEKEKPHECPVCAQYFVLEVVGPGGSPDGDGDDEHHHH